MNFDAVFGKLEELMVELKEKGIDIPGQVIEDLKSGRSLISILKNEAADENTAAEAMIYQQRVEAALLSLADEKVGEEYAFDWQNKIGRAYMEESKKVASTSSFVTGIPKGEHWIRIKTAELGIDADINGLINNYNLFANEQEDGYLLVHGKKEDITLLLKEVRDSINKNKF